MVQEITFGDWLKSRRRILDLTQQALADMVNCSTEMIYRIEAGRRRPSDQLARLIGTALNVPVHEHDAFVKFARANAPTKIHAHRIENRPWQDAFIPNNNLPQQLTALIGREHDLTDALSRLYQEEVRLLTLTGPPGIGKTRMAVQLGNDALLDFPDGVFFVELVSVVHADRVVFAIAHTLDISLTDHKKPWDSLQKYLYERQILLILDNFEHVLDAASDIHSLLLACPLVHVLVTSRSSLRLHGEHLMPIKPLALPDHIGDLNFPELARFATIQLFVERAKAIRPDFDLTPQNAVVIAAICARLDGLPLAIEIAAAQAHSLQPEEILDHLSGQALLESPGMADSDTRQRSLNASIAWSYDLLDNNEQILFRRASVFIDGFDLKAAEAVCQPQRDTTLVLSNLIRASLLKREDVSDAISRYHMLEVIRQFARQELLARGELAEIQARHADYFHSFMLEQEEQVSSNGQVAGLETVEREHSNLQTALDYFIAVHSWEKCLQLIGAMSEFWVYRNHIIVGLQYVTEVLEATVDDDPVLQADRARVLNGAAMMSYFAGDFPAIKPYAEAALAAAQVARSDRDVALACNTLGMQSGGMGHYDAALRYFEQGMNAVNPDTMPWVLGGLLNGLGEIERSQGNYDKAMIYYEKALVPADEMKNLWLSAHVLDNIAHTAYSQGRYTVAEDNIRRSLKASITLGDERGIAMCLEKLGGIAIAQEQLKFAARLLGAAEALRETRNTPVEGMDAADYKHFVNQLHKQLPAAELKLAWMDGRQAPLSQLLEQLKI